MILSLVLVGSVIALVFLYFDGLYNETYWKKRNVKFYLGNKVIGPFWFFLFGKKSLGALFCDIYKKYPDEPAVGLGSLFTPALYVKNPNDILYVMQAPMFHDRGFVYVPVDKLADNVLFMKGYRWKLMRQKMSPLFTSAKLKNMYYIVDKSAHDFVDYLLENPVKLRGNTFTTLTTFCCAAIGAAVFGIGTGSTFDSPFLEMTQKAFISSRWGNLRYTIAHVTPGIFRLLNLNFFKEFETLFIGAMKQVFRLREKENVRKHDFVDICLNLKRDGVATHDSGYQLQMTDEILAAQGFFFFVAGAEPTATGLFGALVEIGRHATVQKRVQEEIDEVFEKYNRRLTYDAISEMVYLEKVLNESLRLYPPIYYLTRRCTKDTVLPESNIKIEKGTKIYTPIYEMHHDPRYFKDPEVYDPDRLIENENQNLGVLYQPFGYGSRVCIGKRYAKLQVKSALAHLLYNFNVKTIIGEGGIKYGKDQVQLRLKNVEIEYVPRKSFRS